MCLLFCTSGKNDKPRKRNKNQFNLRFMDPLLIIMSTYYVHACGEALWTMKIGFKINPLLVFQNNSHKAKS